MYDKTITVFNKYVNQKDEIFWYPTVIKGVQLIVDKSANIERQDLIRLTRQRSMFCIIWYPMKK